MEPQNLSDLLRQEVAKQRPASSKRSRHQPTKAELEQELATLKAALAAVEAEKTAHSAQIEQLQQELQRWRDRAQALDTALQELQTRHQALEAKFEEAKAVIRQLTAPQPYRFEEVGFKPLVNEIPTPNPNASSLGDAEIGWFD
ncbi:hypothetical protein NK55_10410 [Thermosynechococcus sp. NK55a]|jgi:chromosome segregation ATPase|uniref:hypothetical protein n=1 Tax=unclassified Thermosynechococcus TaxID=2622553 RepID=UPI0003D7EC70|nr:MULTISPECIES: hypothetical protein [unclassified Thermosynechococcus]AHB89324.1 hypothetical protein NK55_10410 [Thermosynechococcus sp. NK55a]RMH67075.1 MAG: hypothetical protein D6676_03255 [Cyanobacteria bacterium J003]HIK23407.1 hypothetical protein [Thermosynechococcus sp. M3746_W2019_013]